MGTSPIRQTSLIAMLAMLAACASTPTEGPFPDTISPRCAPGADCAAKWEAAKEFVRANSDMTLTITSDKLIETEIPPPYTGHIGMQVKKEPAENGLIKLHAAAFCGSLKCNRQPWMIVASFNLKISAVKAADPAQLAP